MADYQFEDGDELVEIYNGKTKVWIRTNSSWRFDGHDQSHGFTDQVIANAMNVGATENICIMRGDDVIVWTS